MDHRIELSDEELDMIRSSLRMSIQAYKTVYDGSNPTFYAKLLQRLEDMRPGKPSKLREDPTRSDFLQRMYHRPPSKVDGEVG